MDTIAIGLSGLYASYAWDVAWVAMVVAVACVLWWVAVHRWRQRGSRDPMTWPVLGAQLEVAANAGRIHDWCLRYLGEQHRTFTLRLLGGATLHLTVDPDNLQHMLKTNFHNYPKVIITNTKARNHENACTNGTYVLKTVGSSN